MGKYTDKLKSNFLEDLENANGQEFDFYDYLAEAIFDISTYESEVQEKLVTWCIESCRAILNRKTFEFISEPENNFAYLTVLQFSFFQRKIEWGTSIRGAWFNLEKGSKLPYEFSEYICSDDDFKEFIADVIMFYDEKKGE